MMGGKTVSTSPIFGQVGHEGLWFEGNKVADELAKVRAKTPYTGPEPIPILQWLH